MSAWGPPRFIRRQPLLPKGDEEAPNEQPGSEVPPADEAQCGGKCFELRQLLRQATLQVAELEVQGMRQRPRLGTLSASRCRRACDVIQGCGACVFLAQQRCQQAVLGDISGSELA